MRRLTFFCELEPDALERLFADGSVVSDLLALGAGVSLALPDLSERRAAVARRLQDAGVPLTAWVLLPREEGYFAHAGNVERLEARCARVLEWTAAHGLAFEALGLDIEPDRAEWEFAARHPVRGTLRWARRAFDEPRLRRAEERGAGLVAGLRAQGWTVETYQFPPIVDERRAGSRLLRRATGMFHVPADREVLLLYSSLLVPRGPGPLCSYGPGAAAIAVGSTGGGIDHQPKLSREAFLRDLRLAARHARHLYVFSLEGCAERGLLADLKTFDWQAPPEPVLARAGADALRTLLRGALRAAAGAERTVRALARRPM